MADIELEAQVIGAVINDNALFRDCHFLTEEHFSDAIHAEIWQRMVALMQSGRDATQATLALDFGDRLDAVGGRTLLASLAMSGNGMRTAMRPAADRLREMAQLRRLAALASELPEWIENDQLSADEAISAAIRELRLALEAGGSRARRKRDVARASLQEIAANDAAVPTGIVEYDFLLHGGLMARRLYGILGLYGRGKTIFLGTISDNLNSRGVEHLFISLETPPEDIEIRNSARHINLNAAQLYDRDDPLWAKFHQDAANYVERMKDHTTYEYAPGATIDEIERMILRAKHRRNIRGVLIDYWQLIRGRQRNQTLEEHLKDCVDRLANLARLEGIWIVITAQCDENGTPRYCTSGLQTSAAHVARLVRGENDETAYFETAKSNYTRYANTGNASVPGMIFDHAGPHFRSLQPEDYSRIQHAANEAS